MGRAFSIARGDLDLDLSLSRPTGNGDSGEEGRIVSDKLLSDSSFSGVGGGGGDFGGVAGSCTRAFSGKNDEFCRSAIGDGSAWEFLVGAFESGLLYVERLKIPLSLSLADSIVLEAFAVRV